MRCKLSIWLLVAGVWLGSSNAALAASFSVDVGPNNQNIFSPSTLTISVGDTVNWIRRSGSHDVVSSNNVFRSSFPMPATFSFTFTNAGTFGYFCTPHRPGMAGRIIVQAASNTPPTVSIASPTNGATFTSPATVTIEATAADSGGSVAKVEFFNGTTKLGEDTTSPYSLVVSNLAAGTYSLTARATDNQQATTTSAAVTITVNNPNQAPAVSIASPANGATFNAPASITIEATATDDSGVTRVEFFLNNTSVGDDSAAPYTFSTNLVAGDYTITARAFDNGRLSTLSAPVQITVRAAPTPPRLSAPQRLQDGQFRFTVTGTAGINHVVQATANVASPGSWTSIHTNTAAGGTFTFTDSAAPTIPMRFYRVIVQP